MKIAMIAVAAFLGGALAAALYYRAAAKRLRRKVKTLYGGQEEPKKRAETAKRVVWACLINGFAWVWCSYVLAYLDKMQIAESLSQVAVTEIIGVVLVYCIKSLVENLSKNNRWPDKAAPDSSAGPEPEREEPLDVDQQGEEEVC